MEFLSEHLAKDLCLKKDIIITLDGHMSDVRQKEIVEAFGQGEADVRLLVASDFASEGINLHYLCHRMIHFDIPLSLMVFQQRNGRIDRYGQGQVPYITYLITESEQEKIKGDNRILELLVEKERQAYENIGDPAAIMGAYDVQEAEKRVAHAGVAAPVMGHEFTTKGKGVIASAEMAWPQMSFCLLSEYENACEKVIEDLVWKYTRLKEAKLNPKAIIDRLI